MAIDFDYVNRRRRRKQNRSRNLAILGMCLVLGLLIWGMVIYYSQDSCRFVKVQCLHSTYTLTGTVLVARECEQYVCD